MLEISHVVDLAVVETHAIVLIGVDENSDAFIYYDPVLGGENHKASFTEIYDPRIITEK